MNKYLWSYDDMGTPINIKDMEFICRSCAEKLGGKWSELNDLHHHYTICDGCGRKKSVSHKKDWENLRD